MAKRVQLRRGTTAETNAFTGAVGELTVDTDKGVPVYHDGATSGGYAVAARANTDGGIVFIDRAGQTPAWITPSKTLEGLVNVSASNGFWAPYFVCQNAFTDGTTYTAAGLVVGSPSYRGFSTNGWQKLPSGLILQWGIAYAPANSQSGAYNFPVGFPNAVFVCFGSKQNGEPGTLDGNDSGARAISTTQFVTFSDQAAQNIGWLAIGY